MGGMDRILKGGGVDGGRGDFGIAGGVKCLSIKFISLLITSVHPSGSFDMMRTVHSS
jgi:hypothetical protein